MTAELIERFAARMNWNYEVSYDIGDRNPRAADRHQRRAERYAAALHYLWGRVRRAL